MIKDKKNFWFLSLIFVIGFITTFQYGVNLDQYAEQDILYSNLKEYVLHLPFDVSSIINGFDKSNIIEISQSIEMDHGEAAYYLAFIIWKLRYISGWLLNHFWHAYTFCINFIGIIALFYLGLDLFSNRIPAMIMTLLYVLTPRMFGEMHYNNKDIVLLSFCFCILYFGRKLIKESKWINIFLFALSGAFATNTKIVGAYVFGIVGFYVLLVYIKEKKKIMIRMLTTVLLYFLFYFLITPAMWNDIVQFINFLINGAVSYTGWDGGILFSGDVIWTAKEDVPGYYILTMMALTIPIGILLLSILGFASLMKQIITKKFEEKEVFVLYCSIMVLLPLTVFLLINPLVYNGWRHFYFMYASFVLLSGYTCNKIYLKKNKYFSIGISIYITSLAIGIAVNYPYEYCYYNALAGNHVENRYELDYWEVSMKQVLEFISEDAQRDNKAHVSVSALHHMEMGGLYFNYEALKSSDKTLLEILYIDKTSDYIVINSTYANIYYPEEYNELRKMFEPCKQITSYDNVICEIYKMDY